MVLVINYLRPYITRRSHNALAATLIALRTAMHKVSVPNVSRRTREVVLQGLFGLLFSVVLSLLTFLELSKVPNRGWH